MSDYLANYELEEESLENDANLLGDGANASDVDNGSAESDTDTLDTLAGSSLSLSSTPTLSAADTASNDGTAWEITNLEDYDVDEELIAGSFRWCVGRSAASEDDSIFIRASTLATLGSNVIKIKRSIFLYSRPVYVVQDVDGANFKLVFEPDSSFTNPRFCTTLSSSSIANSSWADIVWRGWNFDSSSIYQTPLFAAYNGVFNFFRCGFIDNTASGSAKAIIACPNSATGQEIEFNFTSCKFYNNKVQNTTGAEELAVVLNLGRKSSAVTINFDSCTSCKNINVGTGAVLDTAWNRNVITPKDSILERYTCNGSSYTQNVSRICPLYLSGDLRVDATQPEARRIRVSLFPDYEGYTFPQTAPIGCLSTSVQLSEDYLVHVFGNNEDLIADALSALDIPLTHSEASNYFGVINYF